MTVSVLSFFTYTDCLARIGLERFVVWSVSRMFFGFTYVYHWLIDWKIFDFCSICRLSCLFFIFVDGVFCVWPLCYLLVCLFVLIHSRLIQLWLQRMSSMSRVVAIKSGLITYNRCRNKTCSEHSLHRDDIKGPNLDQTHVSFSYWFYIYCPHIALFVLNPRLYDIFEY